MDELFKKERNTILKQSMQEMVDYFYDKLIKSSGIPLDRFGGDWEREKQIKLRYKKINKLLKNGK